MRSRYDYMRPGVNTDVDGDQFPDPLTISYEDALEGNKKVPDSYRLNVVNLRKLWWKYYEATGQVDGDDILYNLNNIEHVGELEPEDQILLFDTTKVKQYDFKDLS